MKILLQHFDHLAISIMNSIVQVNTGKKMDIPEDPKNRKSLLDSYTSFHEEDCSSSITNLTRIPYKNSVDLSHNLITDKHNSKPNCMKVKPAVVQPSFLNAGFSFAKASMLVFGRMPSSTDTITDFSMPDFGSMIFGVQ